MNAEVDKYIETFPENIRQLLHHLRKTILEAAPESAEIISYGMPAYKQNGILVYFAGYKNHIGFYPTPAGIENFKHELSSFKTSKGAIQFPVNQPIPSETVKKIVIFRVNEDRLKAGIKKR